MANGLGIHDEEALNIYTDGSSFPKKKRAAGIGVCLVWVNEAGDEEFEEYAPTGWKNATIDEMEIEACTFGMQEANSFLGGNIQFKRVLIFSDSRYVVDNFFKAMNIWPKKRWIGTSGVKVENIELWKRLRKEVTKCPINVDIEWVKAHKRNKYNKAADRLAKQSAEMPFNEPFSHSDTTKKWSDRSTKRGSVKVHGQEIKIRIISREYKKNAKTFEYRYEVIDPNDQAFKDLDFVFYEEYLSRNKCFSVRFGDDEKRPSILEIIEELESSDYKH